MVILSIATATVFWLFNALNKDYDATVGYPINWEFNTEEYIIVDEPPSVIRINVKGLGWNLIRASLGLKVAPITIVLSNPAANKKIPGVSLTNRIADNLEELQLNYILEDTLRMNIDYRDKRSFAVYVDSAGISLAENHRIVSPVNYNVELLEVEGPRGLLYENSTDSYLVSVNEEQIKSNYDEDIRFRFERPELFRFNPPTVNVSFEVAEFIDAERVVNIDRIEFPENGKVVVQDTTCTVQFVVRRDQEQTIVADSFNIIADYNMVNNADSTIFLKVVKAPANVLEVRIASPQVRVTFND